MRLSTSGRIEKYENLSEQIDAAFYGTMDRVHGLEVVSKLLSHVALHAECQDDEELSSSDLHSLSELMRLNLKQVYVNVSEIRQSLQDNEEVENILKESEQSEIIEEYSRRSPTAQESNRDDKKFFDSYFKD